MACARKLWFTESIEYINQYVNKTHSAQDGTSHVVSGINQYLNKTHSAQDGTSHVVSGSQ
jgi:hypothetical protein